MDEEITIIDSNTRNEKVKNFFINNKKNLILGTSILIIIIVGYFTFEELKKRNKIELANQFNLSVINFDIKDKQKTITELTNLVKKNDATYSPLALYFLIDNNLVDNTTDINALFNELINETNLDKETRNLIIYKKALFSSDIVSENDLLQILNPIINSESIWRSHALYLIAEYFYSRGKKKKSKEFFNQLLLLENANQDLKIEAQKRLSRDLSE